MGTNDHRTQLFKVTWSDFYTDAEPREPMLEMRTYHEGVGFHELEDGTQDMTLVLEGPSRMKPTDGLHSEERKRLLRTWAITTIPAGPWPAIIWQSDVGRRFFTDPEVAVQAHIDDCKRDIKEMAAKFNQLHDDADMLQRLKVSAANEEADIYDTLPDE